MHFTFDVRINFGFEFETFFIKYKIIVAKKSVAHPDLEGCLALLVKTSCLGGVGAKKKRIVKFSTVQGWKSISGLRNWNTINSSRMFKQTRNLEQFHH